jgi:hypothetical protein
MHIPIGRELTEQLAKGGGLHSRPIEKLTLADAVAARLPPGAAAVEVVARHLGSRLWQSNRSARSSALVSMVSELV